MVKGGLSAADQLAHWLLNKRHWTGHNGLHYHPIAPRSKLEIVEMGQSPPRRDWRAGLPACLDAAYEQMPYVVGSMKLNTSDERQPSRRSTGRASRYMKLTDTTTSSSRGRLHRRSLRAEVAKKESTRDGFAVPRW